MEVYIPLTTIVRQAACCGYQNPSSSLGAFKEEQCSGQGRQPVVFKSFICIY